MALNSMIGGLDRRSLLKRGAAAGVLAWTAPVVLATEAQANSVCTPKCLPKVPALTATVQGRCDNSAKLYYVTATLSAGSVVCECGGSASLQPATLERPFGVRVSGEQTLEASGVTVTCIDSSGDPCSIVCQVTVVVNITRGNSGNDCARTRVSLVRVDSDCPGPAVSTSIN